MVLLETKESILEALQSEDKELIETALKILISHPTGDDKIRKILENMLDDNNSPFTIVSIKPIRFSELRYIAGQALATERAIVNDDRIVIVNNVVKPISTTEIAQIATKNGFKRESLETMLHKLNTAGLLEMCRTWFTVSSAKRNLDILEASRKKPE